MSGRQKKPKVACTNCARGKRNCSGTFPCERCVRLNKECSFPEDATRRRRVKKVAGISAELLPHPSHQFGSQAIVFGETRRTALSLPRQLFPWQDIRLHMFGPLPTGEGGFSSDDTIAGTAVDDGTGGFGGDDPRYLKYLWDATYKADVVAPAMSHGPALLADGDGDSEEETSEDDEDDYDYSDEEPPPPSVVNVGTKRSRAAAGMSQVHAAPLPMPLAPGHEAAIVRAARASSTPTWVSIYDTNTYELKRLICNDTALRLFGWAQPEIDLRVDLGHVIRWLHPNYVVVRSVVAVNARKGCQQKHTFEGRYLRRKRLENVPEGTLRRLRQGFDRYRQSSASSSASSLPNPLGLTRGTSAPAELMPTPSILGPDGLPMSTPAIAHRPSSLSYRYVPIQGVSTETSDAEDLIAALEELDDCVIYQVFEADEHLTNYYNEAGVLKLVVTEFTNVNPAHLITGADAAAQDAAAATEADDDQELLKPCEIDLSEARPVFESDVAFLMETRVLEHSPSSIANADPETLSVAAVLAGSFAGTEPKTKRLAASTSAPTSTAPVPRRVGTRQAPTIPGLDYSSHMATDRSITTNLVLMREASVESADGILAQKPGDPDDIFEPEQTPNTSGKARAMRRQKSLAVPPPRVTTGGMEFLASEIPGLRSRTSDSEKGMNV